MALSLVPVLSRHEVERIHALSLDLLERVGIDYKTPQALEILEEAGCPVDYERTWASLPPKLVEWAIEQAPRVVRLEARRQSQDVLLDGRRSHHTTDSQGARAVDFETGEVRPSTLQDLERCMLFADALDMVEIVNVTVAATDIPSHIRTIQHFATAFAQTGKHVRTGVLNAAQVPLLVDLVKAVTGEDEFRPIFSTVLCTISPFMHEGPMVEAGIELAKLSVPIMPYPMPLAGGTSPAPHAGTMVVHNAEFLSTLVLLQLVNPGTPLIYGTGASQLDMSTGHYGGGPDVHGLKLGLHEMGRFYNLPTNLWGLSTGSHDLDPQYGFQAATSTLLAYLAGADEIYSVGLLGDAQVLSLEKMVLDNHYARDLEGAIRPVVVDEAHLQYDVIESVGVGGSFLPRRETRDYVRLNFASAWPPAGRRVNDIAREEAEAILAGHRPPPLPQGAGEAIEAILTRADRELTVH
jgi:trimethylamine--corrinoid protein Co-methyltransferase